MEKKLLVSFDSEEHITSVVGSSISVCDFYVHPINDRFISNGQIMIYFSLACALKQKQKFKFTFTS